MDSEEDDYSQYYGSDWSEEAADCTDDEEDGENNELQDSATVDRRKPYKILTEEDIKHLQNNDISTVSGVLSVPRGVACALLCRNNWSLTSVYDHWFAAAYDNAGERNPESVQHICKICYESTGQKEAVSAACGHPFCAYCMQSYITAAVSGGAGCLTLECPEPGCGEAVTSDMVEKLASEADVSRYLQYLRRSYVESSRNRKWYPAAGCDRAVEIDAAGIDSYDYEVVCSCSHAFCWQCSGERHSPLSCTAAAEWAESARWILANTKPCPKCRRPIEKAEGGCNHMVCLAPCRFQFCWSCFEPWRSKNDEFCCQHCGKERERKDSNETKAKRLVRGGNSYERWDFDEESRKIAMAELEKARKKYTGEGRGGMEFVVEAWEQIVECWHVLSWSYVYVCSLSEAMVKKRAVLEHFYAVAGVALDRLQRCVEEDILDGGAQFFTKLLNLTKVARHCLESFVLAMKNEVEDYAPYWDKEALELKNDIAIAESLALDLEKEDLETMNHMAIAMIYAFDLERMENPDSDEALEEKNDNIAEVGSRVFNLEKVALQQKRLLTMGISRCLLLFLGVVIATVVVNKRS